MRARSPISLTFKATGSQTVPFDAPVRWSGFLERGGPRPLNPAYANPTRPGVLFMVGRIREMQSTQPTKPGLRFRQAPVAALRWRT